MNLVIHTITRYNVYLDSPEIYPQYKGERGVLHIFNSLLFGSGTASGGGGYWSNGKTVYTPSVNSTVGDLKKLVYKSDEIPASLKVGCRGRMMEDSDNLALAVKSFCRRDPRILMWTED